MISLTFILQHCAFNSGHNHGCIHFHVHGCSHSIQSYCRCRGLPHTWQFQFQFPCTQLCHWQSTDDEHYCKEQQLHCICNFQRTVINIIWISKNIKIVNANVNVYDYSLISPSVQQASQFTHMVLELSLIQSHLWGEFNICAFCCNYKTI